MGSIPLRVVRPDAKGRITLGKATKGISSYKVTRDSHDRIILEPFVEIPAKEKWLFESPAKLKQVKRGIEQSAKGEVKSHGHFSKYLDEDTE